ncbi:tRNA 2-selenouridine synthase (plasmid) [Fulvitalea axinellae]|uniref:tRNA 2-selenouridine synthase n=1 Tax=Fulvitalea axinellae TaxID=1182444 RepID=A0AAU9DGT0_9BACT|nr:tRNA 2-selenouridine synthase [Fulvitalea axinellae]
MKKVDVEEFLRLGSSGAIVDVRSPGEYAKGHMPGAVNLPIFTDKERAVVGTIYKQKGQQPAIDRGLEIVGPKMAGFVREARKLAQNDTPLAVHCWRGGMRSGSMAWLFQTAGIPCVLLEGGYKAYRNRCLKIFGEERNYVVLSGMTGSGKTELLHAMEEQGDTIIDLEKMANHRGSAFGSLGMEKQPTCEQFSNDLAELIQSIPTDKTIWLEDESRTVGSVFIPEEFFAQMRQAPRVYLDVEKSARVQRLVKDYACFPKEKLETSLKKIGKKLGSANLNKAIQALEADDFEFVANMALSYYDKAYRHSTQTNDSRSVHITEEPLENVIEKIREASKR